MDIDIFAKSSSNPELPYKVNFTIKDGIMNVHCSCPAGSYRQLCKHITSLIDGDSNMLFDNSQQQLLNDIAATVNASPLKDEFSKFKKRKKEIELIQRQLKKELKNIKIDLAMKLQNGIKI